MRKKAISLSLCFLFVLEVCFSCTPALSADDTPGQHEQNINMHQKGFAFSLRESQRVLKKCMPDECPDKLLHLDGMTRIVGFIVDSENKDIILIGEKHNNAPPLSLEDFVLALRKAWDLILIKENGEIKIDATPIGCSIDPTDETDKKWHEFNKKYNVRGPQNIYSIEQERRVHAEFQKKADDWVDICQELQNVRVDGLYHNTRFSKIMVEADYYMKRLVDGSVKLEIDGFKNLMEIRDEQATGSASKKTSMNRFWFTPGENIYIEAENGNAVFLKKSPVTLLTEEEYLDSKGVRKGKGKGEPAATKFAGIFTEKYDLIKKEKPIYEELEGLFRFVAVTKLMGEKRDNLQSIGMLDYFLYQYPIHSTAVWAKVPGIANVGPDIYHFFLSCGGVTTKMDLKLDPNKFGGQLAAARFSVLDARPRPESISWTYRDHLHESGILPIINILPKSSILPSQPIPKKERTIRETPKAIIEALNEENNKKKQQNYLDTNGEKRKETEDQDIPESANIQNNKPFMGKGRNQPPFISNDRAKENLETIKMFKENGKDAILLDFTHDEENLTIGKFVNNGEERFDESTTKELNGIINKTKRISGRLGASVQKDWRELVNNHLLPGRTKKEISIGGKTVNIDKPILILRTDQNEMDFNNFEKIDALTDEFYLYILLKQTPPKQFAKNIINIPTLKKNNVFITLSMPETTSNQEQKKWDEVISKYRQKIGNKKILVNPTKEKFISFLEKQGKDCIALNATHTENGIVFKNNSQFTSSDIRQLKDLSRIKYFMTGIGSCEVGKIGEGSFVKYLRLKGMGSVNFSGKKLIGEKIIENFEILINILDVMEKFEIPAYAVPDIIMQLKEDDEIGVLNLSKTDRQRKRISDSDVLS